MILAQLNDMLVFLRKRKGLSQQELANTLKISRSAIGMYETGKREPDLETLEIFADFYNVDMNTLTGKSSININFIASNIEPIPEMKKIPIVGEIACGAPILAQENITDYADMPKNINADFALICKGDSMVGAGIQDGDIVYIKKQDIIQNGQIAAVIVNSDCEATLKRFYRDGNKVTLTPENPAYPPMVYVNEEINSLRIVGRAVGYLHRF